MKIQAIVIKKVPVRESDELVICYTRDAGKQVYHAKNVATHKSVQRSHLDILNHVEFSTVQGNGHPIIASAYCLDGFPRLKSSLPALGASFFMLEYFDKLIFEGEEDSALWDCLVTTLERYDRYAGLAAVKWADEFRTTYEYLMRTLGHHAESNAEELAHAYLNSLQFFRTVVR